MAFIDVEFAMLKFCFEVLKPVSGALGKVGYPNFMSLYNASSSFAQSVFAITCFHSKVVAFAARICCL